ncbi:hypothetical protein PVL29_018058 [Vitis rotundifolia]|uniref:Uncharacterized protein n=1 Tax=Vitis rotundifolia TaxID=103349 RepID=A0AA38Z407_VITRO|nr:hypothetical protein PVL29_018058 [Vitis rotundifolia]
MHHLLPKIPIEPVNELQNPARFVQFLIQQQLRLADIIRVRKMVNIDVEVDGVAAVVGGGKRAEAAGKGGEAISELGLGIDTDGAENGSHSHLCFVLLTLLHSEL